VTAFGNCRGAGALRRQIMSKNRGHIGPVEAPCQIAGRYGIGMYQDPTVIGGNILACRQSAVVPTGVAQWALERENTRRARKKRGNSIRCMNQISKRKRIGLAQIEYAPCVVRRWSPCGSKPAVTRWRLGTATLLRLPLECCG